VFTAFDRVWPLVGLALALATIVCWITFLSHGAIKLLWSHHSRILRHFAGAQL